MVIGSVMVCTILNLMHIETRVRERWGARKEGGRERGERLQRVDDHNIEQRPKEEMGEEDLEKDRGKREGGRGLTWP